MASDRQNLQDAFLNQVRKTKIPVTVFLINGVKLQGAITWFDNFCILLRRDGSHSLYTSMLYQPLCQHKIFLFTMVKRRVEKHKHDITTVWVVQPKIKFSVRSDNHSDLIGEAISLTKALPGSKLVDQL